MEAKRHLNLEMDGKSEWRIDTSKAITQNDTNTAYGMRQLLKHQLPTFVTPSVLRSVLLGHCQLLSIL